VARAVRTPSQLEHDLTLDFLLGLFGLLPNDNFDSEELIAYELGYRRQVTEAVSLDVATFYNDYSKLAANVVTTGSFPISIITQNGTTAETYGGEAVLNWRANAKLNFSLSYSFLEMQLHGPAGGIDAEDAERQSPRHQFNARTQWNIRDDVSFDTALYRVGELNEYKVDDYWRVDMMLGWKINDALQFNLVGQSVLSGPRHEFLSITDAFTPATKIEPSIYGKLTWRF
jgi:iron complex outermembrane receptor protein